MARIQRHQVVAGWRSSARGCHAAPPFSTSGQVVAGGRMAALDGVPATLQLLAMAPSDDNESEFLADNTEYGQN